MSTRGRYGKSIAHGNLLPFLIGLTAGAVIILMFTAIMMQTKLDEVHTKIEELTETQNEIRSILGDMSFVDGNRAISEESGQGEINSLPTKKTAEKACTSKKDDTPFFMLNNEERRIAECIVMGEAGGESYKGQMLVAQCLLNACIEDGLQPSEVRTAYKYSGWNEYPSESVKKAVSAVFDLGEQVTDEPVKYFYAPKHCNSRWHETQTFVIEVGGHRFFKEA